MATTILDSARVIVRLRTLGPGGLNPPQIEVINHLQTLSEDNDSPITDLDIDIWGASMGSTQTDGRDLFGMRDTVAEFTEWAHSQGYTLQPAFEWRSADSVDTEKKQYGQISTPLITLAIYTGEHLQAVYPHVDDDDVQTIHDGVEALESMVGPGDAEPVKDEQNKQKNVAVPRQ